MKTGRSASKASGQERRKTPPKRLSPRETIVVDLDGTLVFERWPELGPWIDGAQDALRAFLGAGFRVQVCSCRFHPLEKDTLVPRDQAEWLHEVCRVKKLLHDAGLGAVEVLVNEKPPARHYIDDRGIEFKGDWSEVVKRVLA